MYGLRLNYSGVKIDHQNDESPLINEYREIKIPLIFDDNINIQLLKWKTIKYTEEKGLFGTFEKKILGKSNDYYGGEILYDQKLTIDRQQIIDDLEKEFNSKMFLNCL